MLLSTVSTHGSYTVWKDKGETDYRRRLKISIQRVADFVSAIKQNDPEVVILLFGDHKPSLGKYFHDNDILKQDDFETTGTAISDFQVSNSKNWERVGDVPAYILTGDQKRADAFVAAANSKPMFCVSEAYNRFFVGSTLPTYSYTKAACDNFRNEGYAKTAAQFPDWLYSIALFEP